MDKKRDTVMPSFFRENYPYKAIGDAIIDSEMLLLEKGIYELECPRCKCVIRAQGKKLYTKYNLIKEAGCVSCRAKDLMIKKVDI